MNAHKFEIRTQEKEIIVVQLPRTFHRRPEKIIFEKWDLISTIKEEIIEFTYMKKFQAAS